MPSPDRLMSKSRSPTRGEAASLSFAKALDAHLSAIRGQLLVAHCRCLNEQRVTNGDAASTHASTSTKLDVAADGTLNDHTSDLEVCCNMLPSMLPPAVAPGPSGTGNAVDAFPSQKSSIDTTKGGQAKHSHMAKALLSGASGTSAEKGGRNPGQNHLKHKESRSDSWDGDETDSKRNQDSAQDRQSKVIQEFRTLVRIKEVRDCEEKRRRAENEGQPAYQKMEDSVDRVMSVIIFANLVQLGISADMARDWKGWLVVDGFFAVSFLFEMAYKVVLHGMKQFFCGPLRWWSLFDAVVVTLAVTELAMQIHSLHTNGKQDSSVSGGVNLSFLRALRLGRLIRIVRVGRFQFFKELLMMIDGMIGGARTLFWAGILLLMPLYTIALILRETIGDESYREGESQHRTNSINTFSTLPWALFTIFRCITGDCSSEAGVPIFVHLTKDFGWFYAPFYSSIILLTFFGLFNVIIAIFVENTMEAAKSNERRKRWERLQDKERLAVMLTLLVEALVDEQGRATGQDTSLCFEDDDSAMGSTIVSAARPSMFSRPSKGEKKPKMKRLRVTEAVQIVITPDVFNRVVMSPPVRETLDALDIASEDREDLFDILDADGSGQLEVGEIIRGIKMLRGDARRSDIITTTLAIKALSDKVNTMKDLMCDRHEQNAQRQGQMNSKLTRLCKGLLTSDAKDSGQFGGGEI